MEKCIYELNEVRQMEAVDNFIAKHSERKSMVVEHALWSSVYAGRTNLAIRNRMSNEGEYKMNAVTVKGERNKKRSVMEAFHLNVFTRNELDWTWGRTSLKVDLEVSTKREMAGDLNGRSSCATNRSVRYWWWLDAERFVARCRPLSNDSVAVEAQFDTCTELDEFGQFVAGRRHSCWSGPDGSGASAARVDAIGRLAPSCLGVRTKMPVENRVRPAKDSVWWLAAKDPTPFPTSPVYCTGWKG